MKKASNSQARKLKQVWGKINTVEVCFKNYESVRSLTIILTIDINSTLYSCDFPIFDIASKFTHTGLDWKYPDIKNTSRCFLDLCCMCNIEKLKELEGKNIKVILSNFDELIALGVPKSKYYTLVDDSSFHRPLTLANIKELIINKNSNQS